MMNFSKIIDIFCILFMCNVFFTMFENKNKEKENFEKFEQIFSNTYKVYRKTFLATKTSNSIESYINSYEKAEKYATHVFVSCILALNDNKINNDCNEITEKFLKVIN